MAYVGVTRDNLFIALKRKEFSPLLSQVLPPGIAVSVAGLSPNASLLSCVLFPFL